MVERCNLCPGGHRWKLPGVNAAGYRLRVCSGVAPGKAMARRDPGTSNVSICLSSASIDYIRANVQLAATSLSGVEIGVHNQQIFSGERGLLGNGVLSQFRVTIDTLGRRDILEKN